MESSQPRQGHEMDKTSILPMYTIPQTDIRGRSSSSGPTTSRINLRIIITLLQFVVSLTIGLVRTCFPSKRAVPDTTYVHERPKTPEHAVTVVDYPIQTADTKPTNTLVEIQQSHVDCSKHCKGLTSLPLELLAEIMGCLDWMDILQIRKTCRTLYTASMSKTIWLNLYNELASTSMVKSKFERPMEHITGRDLEDAFFQRNLVPLGWTRAGLRHARQRDILDEDAKKFHLVEGGRWLLVVTSTGSVSCHDLDDPDIRERELIPDQVNWNEGNIVWMDVDVDSEEELLTLTLVLSIRERYVSLHRRFSETFAHVWKVKLELDDEGHGFGLKATRLALFPLEKHGSIQSLSILGTLICYRVSSTNYQQPNYIGIVDWGGEDRDGLEQPAEQADSEQGTRPRGYKRRIIHIEKYPAKMRLIPGNQLVIASNGCIKLYKFGRSPLQDSTAIPRDEINRPTECSWSVNVPYLISESLSRPFTITTTSDEGRVSKTVRLVTCAHRGVHGLIFPLNDSSSNSQPQTVKLMDYIPGPSDCDYAVGYNRGVVRYYLPQIALLQYSWPDDVRIIPPSMLPKKIVCERWHRANPYIDEHSGRVIVSATGGEHIVVLDTSLYRRTSAIQ